MITTNQGRLVLVLFIFFFYTLKIEVVAQSANSVNNESDHLVHPKIKLPEIKKKSKSNSSKPHKRSFKTVKWLELMPKRDLDTLRNPPDYLMNTDEGSMDDEIPNELRNLPKSVQDEYQRALTSMEVIEEMNNQAIRIPGFVVPLEFNEEKKITQFFLVPYFGACIHLPPPPPNQIIFVTFNKGIELRELLDPVWISGILQTSHFENEVAISAYSMKMKSYEMYEELF